MAIKAKVSRGIDHYTTVITSQTHRIAADGYVWEFCGALDRRARVYPDRYLRPVSDNWKPLDLSEYPGLFLSLAETDSTEEGVLRFANRYGMMGFHSYRHAFLDIQQTVEVEPLLSWKQQILDCKFIIDLWSHLRHGESREIAKAIGWADVAHSALAFNPASDVSFQQVILDIPKGVGQLDDLDDKRILDFGWAALRRMLNEKLREVPIIRQFAIDTAGMMDTVETALATVWHSAAAAIASDARFNKCPHCEKWFRVSVDKQDDVRFCSVSCRNKAYRWRIATARKLFEEGKPVAEIAAGLDVEESSVLKWVKEQ